MTRRTHLFEADIPPIIVGQSRWTDGDTFAIHSWAVTISAGWLFVIIMLAALSHLISSTVMVRQLRRGEEQAQLELRVYKWHLEQLLPTAGEPAFTDAAVSRDRQPTWNHVQHPVRTIERLADALYRDRAGASFTAAGDIVH